MGHPDLWLKWEIQRESYGILMVIPPGYCFCGGVSRWGTGVSLVGLGYF
jgi:hypothetical protein